jgi:nucleotide-binding universal stress UspA family protein
VILKAAVAEGADLIVIGTQGLGGFRKWILGSVTERVLRGTQIAVLAVPPPGEGRGSGAADVAIGSGPLAVATDFSESSSAAVKQAALFARHFAVPLVLVHIVEAVTAPAQWRALGEQSDERRITDARGRLRRMADQLPNSRDYESVVAVGRPAPLIGSIAEERGATLIVMGLTGEQGAFAPRPGSIAYRVLCATTIPVLVVPPAKTGSR